MTWNEPVHLLHLFTFFFCLLIPMGKWNETSIIHATGGSLSTPTSCVSCCLGITLTSRTVTSTIISMRVIATCYNHKTDLLEVDLIPYWRGLWPILSLTVRGRARCTSSSQLEFLGSQSFSTVPVKLVMQPLTRSSGIYQPKKMKLNQHWYITLKSKLQMRECKTRLNDN